MDSNEFDRIVAEKDAEIGRLRKRIVHLKEQRTLMEHKVIACGVAATHPDAQLAASGVYKTEWNSQQLEEVIALRARAEAAEAKLQRAEELDRQWHETHAACMDESCDGIEKHCTCVGTLREAVRRAEAKCAELEKRCAEVQNERERADRVTHVVLSSLKWTGDGYEWTGGRYDYRMNPSEAVAATMNEFNRLTAQLAAANERIREAYAILCQLDNVYRRQSTESVGSFSVTQEVHSLLKRAMDTLNGKGRK